MTIQKVQEVMERLHVYTTQGGRIIAWTDDPDLVMEAKNAVHSISTVEQTYRLQDVPYTDVKGGKQKWELQGFPPVLLEAARQVASDQAVARGHAPIEGYERDLL